MVVGFGCSGGVPLINIGFFVLFLLCFVGGFLYGGGAGGTAVHVPPSL